MIFHNFWQELDFELPHAMDFAVRAGWLLGDGAARAAGIPEPGGARS